VSDRWKEDELTPESPNGVTPERALTALFGRALVTSTFRNGPRGIPGEAVARMSGRVREALQNLRSEDVQDVRAEDTRNWFL